MANAAEKGGGSVVHTPVVKQKKSSVAIGRKVSAPRPTKVRRVSNTNYSNNNKQNYQRAVTRKASNTKSAPQAPSKPTAKVIVPTAPPKPVAPDINKFLAGDSTYQQQLAAFGKSLSDFQADQGLSQGDYNTNYQNTYRDIGTAKGEASTNLEEDYASRGLLKSGLYNTALGDLNSQYQNQYNDLGAQKTAFLASLAQEANKYKNEQGVQKGNAYNEAVRRRAEKYNL